MNAHDPTLPPAFPFAQQAVTRFAAGDRLAHLWLVPNPAHNPRGDFGLSAEGLALSHADQTYTFSTIGLYRATLFTEPYCAIARGNPAGTKAALAPILRAAMDRGQVSAQLFRGAWHDVGTLERLAALGSAASG